MANLLDEVTGPVNDNGRDVRVIEKQLPVEIGFGSVLFEIALWVARLQSSPPSFKANSKSGKDTHSSPFTHCICFSSSSTKRA